MLISELIRELKALKKKHGDLSCYLLPVPTNTHSTNFGVEDAISLGTLSCVPIDDPDYRTYDIDISRDDPIPFSHIILMPE